MTTPCAPDGCLPISTGDGAFRTLKTSETVAREIARDIVSNKLNTGHGLPHEAAMLVQYGVSRESLREALRLLEVQGLITIRRGPTGGPSVGVVDPANLGRTTTLYYHLAGATYAELFRAWILSQGVLAELAARNPDRRAVRAGLAPFLAAENSTVGEERLAEFVVRHVGFHTLIGRLSANRVLELTMQTFGQIVTHHFIGDADPRKLHDPIVDDHLAIARAIDRGDHRRAKDLMEDHVRQVAEYYEAAVGADRMTELIEWR